MLPREYKNLDRNHWHNLLEVYSMSVTSCHGDFWFMGKGIWRRPKYAFEFYAERNNLCALDRSLTAMGEARRHEVEPAVAARAISDMKTWYGVSDETKDVLDTMLADLDQWARDSEAEAEAIAKAIAKANEVAEEPQKKSFFKRIFSK